MRDDLLTVGERSMGEQDGEQQTRACDQGRRHVAWSVGGGHASPGRWRGGGPIEIEQLEKWGSPAGQAHQEPHQGEQDKECPEEDDPALEEVQEALGELGIAVFDEEAGERDASAIQDDGDGDGRQQDEGARPERASVEPGAEKPERGQREEITQTAAGFGYLQLVNAEVDNVAVEKDADSQEIEDACAKLRGDQLQRGRERDGNRTWQGKGE